MTEVELKAVAICMAIIACMKLPQTPQVQERLKRLRDELYKLSKS